MINGGARKPARKPVRKPAKKPVRKPVRKPAKKYIIKMIRGGDGSLSYSCTACSVMGPATAAATAPAATAVGSSPAGSPPPPPPAATAASSAPTASSAAASAPAASSAAAPAPRGGTAVQPPPQAGGGRSLKNRKLLFKKKLQKFKLEILQKQAKKHGIKILTTKNGKKVAIKKDNLINKICKYKFP